MKKLVSILGFDYGVVGEKTNYKDINGQPIHIGDIVKVEVDIEGRKVTVEEPMVKSNVADSLREKSFIMGIESICNDSTGEIGGETLDIEVIKSYKDLEDDEFISIDNYIRVVSIEN